MAGAWLNALGVAVSTIYSTLMESSPQKGQVKKFITSPKGLANRDTLLKAFKFTLLQFHKELLSYEHILTEQIAFDFRNSFGIYSPDLDLDSAIIKIANGAGYMIPHRVRDIKADPDKYCDSYKICALLYKELHDNWD